MEFVAELLQNFLKFSFYQIKSTLGNMNLNAANENLSVIQTDKNQYI